MFHFDVITLRCKQYLFLCYDPYIKVSQSFHWYKIVNEIIQILFTVANVMFYYP